VKISGLLVLCVLAPAWKPVWAQTNQSPTPGVVLTPALTGLVGAAPCPNGQIAFIQFASQNGQLIAPPDQPPAIGMFDPATGKSTAVPFTPISGEQLMPTTPIDANSRVRQDLLACTTDSAGNVSLSQRSGSSAKP
jgi:hypothetical protein